MSGPLLHADDPTYGRDWIAPFEDEPDGAPPVPPSRWSTRWWWIKRGLVASAMVFVLLFIWLVLTAPLSKSLQPIAPPALTLLAADGQPFARNGAIIGEPVRIAALPKQVRQAFIAIEDRRFYSHWGIDPRGVIRATLNNMGSGGTQGGSTITQQLAKITFLTPERSLSRKAREMLIAFWLEAWLTKDEILERYLSNVYFGDNVYGLRAASLHYFYRQPEKLTLSQAALLAGLVQAPSRLAPTKNPKAAQKRAQMVLNAMASAGFISEAKAKTASPAAIDRREQQGLPTGTYFADWAMPQARAVAEESYGEQKIQTTLDARLQKVARAVIAQAPLGNAQVALVAMRPSGEVVAMIGGRSYDKSPFNRATQARRQPGSTFKLFVYLAALRAGMTPDSKIDDSPITTGGYRPKNSGERYRGEITLKQAFARSSNVAAVKLYQKLGDAAVLKAAHDLGISSPLSADPSLALGTSGVTLLELTSAYAAVAAQHYPVTPHAIPVTQPGFLGKLLSSERSFGANTQKMLMELLAAPINQGTGHAAALRVTAFGKTGTSQDNRDALFIGFASDLVVGVWVGNDDNTSLRGINGGNVPARIWREFMIRAISGAGLPAPPKPAADEANETLAIPPIELGNDSSLILGNDSSISLDTNLGDVSVNLKLDRDGLSIDAKPPPEKAEKPK
ncbi:MAG: transglycosylase domain-containing protein [Novosphingobium sp.]